MAINTGTVLRINLTTGKTSEEPIPRQIAEDFVGGRGYGVRYLYDELQPGTDPLGPDNKLLLIAGPLAGTGVQATSRWMVVTKSPATGAFARSVCGADFGAWLKFTGHEMIIIEGKASQPCYVHISDAGVKVLPADKVWGKDTKVTQQYFQDTHGKNTRAACIGPAGEKLVNYAAIVSDRRTAGRCGTGAVMGSKNLKAVAITANRKLTLARPDEYDALAKAQVQTVLANGAFQNHKEWGTTGTQDVTNAIGIYPVRNFTYGQMEDYSGITGESYRRFRTGDMGCYSCAARCGKVHTITGGTYKGAHSEGPEYETIWSFTGPIESDSLEASVRADELCDDLGLDTISAGNTIGFAFELYEKGLITGKDTGGLELTWGNHRAMVKLVEMIGRREGIGDLLAEGTRRIAEKLGHGSAAYAIHVKGLELPAYEPRGAKSQGYNYATASVGASHCYGYAAQDIFGAPFPHPTDRFDEGNADIVIFNQNQTAWHECGIACAFSGGWGWMDAFGKLCAAARGIDNYAGPGYLDKVGERMFNLERAFNVREGLGRKDDYLPKRIREEGLHTRKADGEGQTVSRHDEFLDKYYTLRGWSKDGVPTQAKLKELNLGFAARDIK